MSKMTTEQHERLVEIHEEMHNLLHEAKELVRSGDSFEYERAKGYWAAHIDAALGGGSYGSRYDVTMKQSIKALDPDREEDEEDEDDE